MEIPPLRIHLTVLPMAILAVGGDAGCRLRSGAVNANSGEERTGGFGEAAGRDTLWASQEGTAGRHRNVSVERVKVEGAAEREQGPEDGGDDVPAEVHVDNDGAWRLGVLVRGGESL